MTLAAQVQCVFDMGDHVGSGRDAAGRENRSTPGGTVDSGAQNRDIELVSVRPVERLEIIVNGEIVRTLDGFGGKGSKRYSGTVDLPKGGVCYEASPFPSRRTPAPETDPRAVRPLRYPGHEAGDLRVHGQGFDGVELALETLVIEGCVYVCVARAAQQRDPVFHVAALEVALVAPVPVARLGDEVVPREFCHLSAAQFTGPAASYPAAVFHRVSRTRRRCYSIAAMTARCHGRCFCA